MLENNSKYLVIDGYNIIFSWENLKSIFTRYSLDNARKKLIDILDNFSIYSQEKIILVFDAYKVNNGIEYINFYGNIIVVYTKEKETADNYIERTVKQLTKKYIVRVATSDITEQIIIIGSGANVVSANLLYEEVSIVMANLSEFATKRPIKNNLLIDNLDKKTLYLIEEMRMNPIQQSNLLNKKMNKQPLDKDKKKSENNKKKE